MGIATVEHGSRHFPTPAERLIASVVLVALFKAANIRVGLYNDPNGPDGINLVSLRFFDQRIQTYIGESTIGVHHDQWGSYLTDYCHTDLKKLEIECKQVNPFE